jgi:hypothetical protein
MFMLIELSLPRPPPPPPVVVVGALCFGLAFPFERVNAEMGLQKIGSGLAIVEYCFNLVGGQTNECFQDPKLKSFKPAQKPPNMHPLDIKLLFLYSEPMQQPSMDPTKQQKATY